MPPSTPSAEEVQSGHCLCRHLRSRNGVGRRADLAEDLLNVQIKDMNEEHSALNKNHKVSGIAASTLSHLGIQPQPWNAGCE